MYGHDENMIPDINTLALSSGPPVTFSGGFAQAQYWFYPWLIGIMRYDVVNSPTDFLNGASRHASRNRLGPGIQLLVRANVKLAFEYQRKWQQPIPDSQQFFRANTFAAGVDYSF